MQERNHHCTEYVEAWLNALRYSDRMANSVTDFSQLGIKTSLPCNTSSMETWSTIAKWLQECSAHHRCLAHINTCWYPTRLVERLSETIFRVIRSELATPGQGYITLSHQWGGENLLKLTQDQLPAFEKGLPINKLRRTFREALVIAYRMSIPWCGFKMRLKCPASEKRSQWEEWQSCYTA